MAAAAAGPPNDPPRGGPPVPTLWDTMPDDSGDEDITYQISVFCLQA